MKNEKEFEMKQKRSSTIKKKPNNWTEHEDKLLLEKAKENHFRNWSKVASFIRGRSAIQCSARYKRIQPGLIKGAWTPEEDEKLIHLSKNFGRNWCNIAKYMPTRTGKQIRDRFLNALDPSLNKNKFTKEEDNKIVELYKVNGKSWCLIAQNLSGRTGDMVKNRFYSSLKKHVNDESETNHNLIGKKRRHTKKSITNNYTTKVNSGSSTFSENNKLKKRNSRNSMQNNNNDQKKRLLKRFKPKMASKISKDGKNENSFLFNGTSSNNNNNSNNNTNTNLLLQSNTNNNNIIPGFISNIDNQINGLSLMKESEFGARMAQIYDNNQSQSFNPVPSLSLKIKNESANKDNSFICDNLDYSSIIHNIFSNPFNARPQGGLQNLQYTYTNNNSSQSTNGANNKIVNDHFRKLAYDEQIKLDSLKVLIDEQSNRGFNKENFGNQLKLLKEIKCIIKEKQAILNKN